MMVNKAYRKLKESDVERKKCDGWSEGDRTRLEMGTEPKPAFFPISNDVAAKDDGRPFYGRGPAATTLCNDCRQRAAGFLYATSRR